MNEDVYRRLAGKLDAFPTGFAPTPSGVELRLLEHLFSPEEAALAAAMGPDFEPASAIAGRVGVSAELAQGMLEAMAQKGLIHARRSEAGAGYALAPFIGTIFEAQLPRMSREFASLFERYYEETRGGRLVDGAPPVHRVIPVEQSIPTDVEIYPYERASELLAQARSWAVRDCVCRVQQRQLGKGCQHPIDVCLLFAPVENAFADSEVDRPISKEEALEILRRAEEAGLVHSSYNYREGIRHICNCCTCACVFLRGAVQYGRLSGVAHSHFRSAVDAGLCAGCGDCTERCPFGALSLPGDTCVVDAGRCMGCGLCASVCPTGALHLERLPESEAGELLADRSAWASERLRRRSDPAAQR